MQKPLTCFLQKLWHVLAYNWFDNIMSCYLMTSLVLNSWAQVGVVSVSYIVLKFIVKFYVIRRAKLYDDKFCLFCNLYHFYCSMCLFYLTWMIWWYPCLQLLLLM